MTTEAFQEALAEIVSVIGPPDYQDQHTNDAMWETSGEGRYRLFDEEPGASPSVTFVVTWGKPTVQSSSEWRLDRSPDAIAPTLAATMAGRWLMQKLRPETPQARSSTTKTKRKAIPKAVRFEVFKRDKFTCQYCGAKAPDVMLECDHITPHSLTQDNSILNLVTACHACNNGKSDKVLSDDSALAKQHAQLSQLQERRDQLEMMMQWQRGLAKIDTGEVDALAKFYEDVVPGRSLTDSGKADIKTALRFYSVEIVATILRETVATHLSVDGGKATPETAEIVARVFFNELKYRHVREKNPDQSALFYIRGIIRKRNGYWSDSRNETCLNYLRDAYDAGVPIEWMKTHARMCFDWRRWELEISEKTEAARVGT